MLEMLYNLSKREGRNDMNFLNFFTEFDFASNLKWIAIGVGGLILIIILIVLLKKHFKTMLFLVFLIGLGVLFFWAKSQFALSFSEVMACNEIDREFDKEKYNALSHDTYTVYYKKTVGEDGKVISNSAESFAVRKLGFIYVESNPEFEGVFSENNAGISYYCDYKCYMLSAVYYILQVEAKIIANNYISFTGPDCVVTIPRITAYSGSNQLSIDQIGTFTYKSNTMPTSIKFGSYTINLSQKEAK